MSSSRKARDALLVRDTLLVNLSACKYPLVREAAGRMGYEVVEDEAELWDVFWSDLSVSSDRVQRLLPFQRLNHFPGMLEICRKAALSRHMARMAARLPSEYRFYPLSLVLPDQLDDLMAVLKRNKARTDAAAASASGGGEATAAAASASAAGVSTFILKPSAGTQGRGIALVQYPHQLAEAGDVGSCVAQAYVSSPLLLEGFKFDLRVYALVISVDPLRIYLYDEGLARLATEPYMPPSPANLRNTTMHLTNYAVNKMAAGFVSADAAPVGGGSKRPMSLVLAQLAAQYGTTQASLQRSIADVVNKTVMAIQPLLAHTYHTSLSTTAAAACPPACSCPSLDHVAASAADPTTPCGCPSSLCFELLGFDIMFDTQLQPWLLEVNHSPSFGSDSRLDRAVKGELLARTLQMLGQQPEARRIFLEAEAKALSERLYSSPAGAICSSHTANGGSHNSCTSPGAVMRRAQSALPRSRQLQAAAVALEEISANSTALLAAGGHVWGSGDGSSSSNGTCGGGGARNGYHRPASSGAASSSSPRSRQVNTSYTGGAAKRSLSFTSGNGSDGCSSLGVAGGFKLVFPISSDEDRKRYCRILQTAADIYPQQRCQCPWCSRRREISLIAMSGQQLSLSARPPSAVSSLLSHAYNSNHSHGLSGHLPARPGSLSVHRHRSGLLASSTSAAGRGGGGAGVAGEDGGSDTDGSATAISTDNNNNNNYHSILHHTSSPGSLSASVGTNGGGLFSRSSPSQHDGLRGKPPRPSSALRSVSRSRSGPERQQSASRASTAAAAPGSAGGQSAFHHNQQQQQNHHAPPFPAAPTMSSVLAGYGNGYGGGSAARTVLQQRRAGSAVGTSSGTGTFGGQFSEISLEITGEYARAASVGVGGSQPSEPSDDSNEHLYGVHHYRNSNNHQGYLSDFNVQSGDAPPALGDAAATSADAAENPHSRSNQLLSALRPRSHTKSHPQTRLGSAPPPHHQHYPQQQQEQQGSVASGRWPLRGRYSGGCGSGGGAGQTQQQRPSSYLGKACGQGEARGDPSGVRSSGTIDAATLSRATQHHHQPRQQGATADDASYGRRPGASPSRGGASGGSGRADSRRKAVASVPASGQRDGNTCRRRGGSTNSPEGSSIEDQDGNITSGLRRSLSCGELGVKGNRGGKSSKAIKDRVGEMEAHMHQSNNNSGAIAATAAAAVAARPWLAVQSSASGGNGSCGPAQFLIHSHAALTLSSGRLMYGSSGGSSELSQDIYAPGNGAAAATSFNAPAGFSFIEAIAGGKGLAAASGGCGGGGGGGGRSTAIQRPARFSGSRRHGSTSGATMSPADLELLLVRAKTASALNNRFVAVYMQGGSNARSGANSAQ